MAKPLLGRTPGPRLFVEKGLPPPPEMPSLRYVGPFGEAVDPGPRPEGPAISRTPLTDQLDRIEAKLDALLAVLADEEVEADEPAFSLDGEQVEGGERNQDEEL